MNVLGYEGKIFDLGNLSDPVDRLPFDVKVLVSRVQHLGILIYQALDSSDWLDAAKCANLQLIFGGEMKTDGSTFTIYHQTSRFVFKVVLDETLSSQRIWDRREYQLVVRVMTKQDLRRLNEQIVKFLMALSHSPKFSYFFWSCYDDERERGLQILKLLGGSTIRYLKITEPMVKSGIELNEILGDIEISELECSVVNAFETFDFGFPQSKPHPKRITISSNVSWLTNDQVTQLNNYYIDLKNLEKRTVVERFMILLDGWLNGENSNLGEVHLRLNGRWSERGMVNAKNEIFNIYKGYPFDETRREMHYITFNNEHAPTHEQPRSVKFITNASDLGSGRDFQRSDGKIASILINKEGCHMFVWHDRFPLRTYRQYLSDEIVIMNAWAITIPVHLIGRAIAIYDNFRITNSLPEDIDIECLPILDPLVKMAALDAFAHSASGPL